MKKDLPKFVPSSDRDKANTNVSQTLNFENSVTHVPVKEINSEFAKTTFPLSCTPMTRNEFTGSELNALYQLSIRYAEVYPANRLPRVDEKDCHCR